MNKPQKTIYLFCREGCAPCEGMLDMIEQETDVYDGVHIVKLMADDGEKGSRIATDLGIMSAPMLVTVTMVPGRRSVEFYRNLIERFMSEDKS